MDQCTKERFLEDVKEHTLEIKKDDGVYRHLTISNNGSSVYRYDITTWPGHLCVSGDMGSYVFSRLNNMFSFFNDSTNNLNINPSYWGEKLIAIGTNAGYKEFSYDLFEKGIKENFETFKYDEVDDIENTNWTDELMRELWSAIEDDVLMDARTEETAYDNVSAFEFESFNDENETVKYSYDAYDLFDGGYDEYTLRYIWGLYSIVHGIQLYSDAKANE